MIKDATVAKWVSDLMLEFGKKLDESVAEVQNNCSNEEFVAYRKAIGRVMGDMLLEVMNPIYTAHPEIKPKELR
ncbi:hypothetical protein [Dyella humicola]|uniref:hypothetical protein n=1 Tax=Dyella humicola TaxID=2992126 RepID=UPI0022550008|nr:hypothetical protein [Dyella humicola]